MQLNPMTVVLLVLASAAYALGGLFMKLSAGLSRPAPTAAFLALFVSGAMLQALGMQGAPLGVSYIFVLGLEAVITVCLSALYLQEGWPLSRVAAAALVLLGIAWLRRT